MKNKHTNTLLTLIQPAFSKQTVLGYKCVTKEKVELINNTLKIKPFNSIKILN